MKLPRSQPPQPWLLPLTYGLLVLAGVGCVLLESAAALTVVAGFAMGFTALLFADFSKLSVGAHGMTAERERKAEELTKQLNEDAAPLVRNLGRSETESDQHVTEQLDLAEQYEQEERTREAQRREDINRLITDAAEWGWAMAQIGFSTPPRPVIEWRDDEPLIMYGQGDLKGMRCSRLGGTL